MQSIVVVNAHFVLSQAVVRRMSRPDHSAPRFLLLRWLKELPWTKNIQGRQSRHPGGFTRALAGSQSVDGDAALQVASTLASIIGNGPETSCCFKGMALKHQSWLKNRLQRQFSWYFWYIKIVADFYIQQSTTGFYKNIGFHFFDYFKVVYTLCKKWSVLSQDCVP